MRLIRELSRRKLRTTLTILGITIGIWSLVVFSSLANKINRFLDAGSTLYAGKIIVTDRAPSATTPIPHSPGAPHPALPRLAPSRPHQLIQLATQHGRQATVGCQIVPLLGILAQVE